MSNHTQIFKSGNPAHKFYPDVLDIMYRSNVQSYKAMLQLKREHLNPAKGRKLTEAQKGQRQPGVEAPCESKFHPIHIARTTSPSNQSRLHSSTILWMKALSVGPEFHNLPIIHSSHDACAISFHFEEAFYLLPAIRNKFVRIPSVETVAVGNLESRA
eukprot:TRINITY_DN2233_c0_g1_i3.p1 TRINITY_DN2233_c0_g1~~TRINITY_DN2233_c0_g1_i3.p1  ORF type:complete len:158 (+),score=2.70 TRINITY_DN2233_c0_g1_i3:460-933(+)